VYPSDNVPGRVQAFEEFLDRGTGLGLLRGKGLSDRLPGRAEHLDRQVLGPGIIGPPRRAPRGLPRTAAGPPRAAPRHRPGARCRDMAAAEPAPVGEDRRQDLTQLGGPEPQEPVPGPPCKGLPQALGQRRFQLRRIVRCSEQETAVRRQAGDQARVVQGMVILLPSLANYSGTIRGGALAKWWPGGMGYTTVRALRSSLGLPPAPSGSPRPDGTKGRRYPIVFRSGRDPPSGAHFTGYDKGIAVGGGRDRAQATGPGGSLHERLHAFEMSDHIKQVARLWVAPRPQHPHEALGRPAGLLAQRLKANRGIDVIAQDRLAGLRVAGQKALQGFG
jgi:hypothetical protein